MEVKNPKSKMIEASLIICHHSEDCRILKQVKGSGSTYYCGPNESRVEVHAIKATAKMLKVALADLSIIIDDEASILKVADKFYDELISRKGSRIVWINEAFYQGLYRVTKYNASKKVLKKLCLE